MECKLKERRVKRGKKVLTKVKITLPENGRPKITSLKINLY